ncbi:MAG: hypothetical protein DI551_06900 [Micavibrio aeruginosavorus]|uniref:Uncharacterized protein n=1 Tax=Micavibrio aeruginosavorus TaxID=349221 RepID=A0A2W5N490_9BACT|nr:MAG: hypothetical protein DI551_06900 [Micavibrio aeruginosavorus]
MEMINKLEKSQQKNWNDFCQSIEENIDQDSFEKYIAVKDILLSFGVRDTVINAIEKGCRHQDWKEAIIAFSNSYHDDVCFYAGPMTPNERLDYKNGLILLKKSDLSQPINDKIHKNMSSIGLRLFGSPCDFGGRRVELYNVISSAGSMVQKTPPIALFTPFYLKGWKELGDQNLQRRTILFHSAVKDRFLTKTYPKAKQRFKMDDKIFDLDEIDNDQLNEAIALWLLLHEMMHASGPLPLFGAKVQKLPLGKLYGAIEEARVDMSVWTILHHCEDILGKSAQTAKYIILMERLFRSSLLGSNLQGKPVGAEGEHGLFWVNLLLGQNVGSLDTEGNVSLRADDIQRSLMTFLGEVYESESSATDNDKDEGRQILEDLSSRLRERYLSDKNINFHMNENWIQRIAQA